MFTGIIEDVGSVVKRGSSVLSVETALKDFELGESVAVNGVCLTVAKATPWRDGTHIEFDFSPETRSRTNIAAMRTGSAVNLERALKVGDRLGGHFMTGHIEGTGTLLERKRAGESWMLKFSVDKSLVKYIVSKGSVGVDGVSLTVVASEHGQCSVAIIPHTMDHTNFSKRRIGDVVNIEPDILAKYVEQLIQTGGLQTRKDALLNELGLL